jgi:general secretion pathway protein D
VGSGLNVGGIVILALVLSACAPPTRDNVFLRPPGDASEAGAGQPPADVVATTGLPDGAEAGTRAPTVRRSPVIRLPTDREPGRAYQLRPPIDIGPDGTVTMAFERIAIPDFARAVFGETLGLDYTVAPGVTGAISLQISQPVPREAILPIAEQALAAAGVLVRRDGALFILEPDPRGAVPGGPPSTVAVRRLVHADRAQMEQALQPFVTPDARVSAGPLPNSLVLSGSTAGVEALSGLVDVLDIDPLASRAFALFPLSTAAAADVAEELRFILAADQAPATRVLELERMNSVLVVTDSQRAIEEAQYWVRQLDLGEAAGAQIHVYQVQNRRAAELAGLLREALGAGAGAAGLQRVTGVAPAMTEVAVTGEAAEPIPVAGPERVSGRSVAPAGGQLGDVAVLADEGTNSIMTIATPERYAVIEAALRRLDIQPVQVLIEATIIEVALEDELSYGVRWFFESGDVSATFSDLPLGAVAPVFPGFNFVLDTSDVRAVVSALDSVSDVEVVSSPSLMVLNNETARLQVGDEVPIVTRTAQSVTDPDAPIVNEVELRQTGVILEITPRVNASGVVLLDIVQEVSDAVPTTTSGIDSATISQRHFRSSVLLRDRETVALGGLIRARRSDGKAGIPILSEIPVLGALFGSTELLADRTELMVILRPIVVRNHQEARAAYLELREKLKGLDSLSGSLPTN